MAGGVLRGFGIFFMVLGVIGLVGGVAVMGFVTAERSDQNELERLESEASGEADDMDDAFRVGAVGALVGLVLLVVGIVLNAAGKSARDRARHEEVLAAAIGQGGTGPPAAPAQPPAAPPAPQVQTAPAPPAAVAAEALEAREGEAAVADAPPPASDDPDRTSGALLTGVVLAVVAIVAVGLALMAAGGIGDDGGTPNVAGPGGPLLETKEFDGHLTGYASDGGGASVSGGTSDHTWTFDAHSAARHITLELSWTAEEGGADELRLVLERRGDDGDWHRLGTAAGSSPVRLDHRGGSALGGADLRVRVLPNEAGFTARQDFHVDATFWSG